MDKFIEKLEEYKPSIKDFNIKSARTRKYVKKGMLYVIIVMLLGVQAWADLTLPDYTSKIVNVGIQARRNRKFITRCY